MVLLKYVTNHHQMTKLIKFAIFSLFVSLAAKASIPLYLESKTVNRASDWQTSYYQSDLRLGVGVPLIYAEAGAGSRFGGTQTASKNVTVGEIGGVYKVEKVQFKYKFELDKAKTLDTKGELRVRFAF